MVKVDCFGVRTGCIGYIDGPPPDIPIKTNIFCIPRK